MTRYGLFFVLLLSLSTNHGSGTWDQDVEDSEERQDNVFAERYRFTRQAIAKSGIVLALVTPAEMNVFLDERVLSAISGTTKSAIPGTPTAPKNDRTSRRRARLAR